MNKKKKCVYQPAFDNDAKVIGHPEATVFSFQVWRKKKNLLADYPNCKPERYDADGIEEPTYMD